MPSFSGQWSDQQVGGHPCEIYRPQRPGPFVVVYLHDLEPTQLHANDAMTELFARAQLTVVAPRTGASWWVDRVSPQFDRQQSAEQHMRKNVLPWITETFAAAPPRLALLGVGMGGQGVLRLAYKHPDTFPVVAAIRPLIDFQQLWYEDEQVLQQMYADPEAARQETALLYIHPLNWPRNQFFCCDPADYRWWESVDRLRMKLASLGIPFEFDLETSAGGVSSAYIERMAPRAVDFIAERLERERRRLH